MRYKVIDNKRLNVYLTKKDLQKENVTIEDIVEGSTKSITRIKKICKVVSRLAHFNIDNHLLNIVLMPIVDGDLIISAGISEDQCSIHEKAVYVFENFENVLDACYALKEYKLLSSLYQMDSEYYMLIESVEYHVKKFKNLCTILNEFGTKMNFSGFFIEEHGKLIIKNHAVTRLVDKFS